MKVVHREQIVPRFYPKVCDEMIVDDSAALPAQKAIIQDLSCAV